MEGYWTTHFEAGTTRGDGIAMLKGGELLGGDLEHIWSGSYEEEGNRLTMRIRLSPFVTREEEGTMARELPVIMSLEGTCTEESASLSGHPDHRADLLVRVEMRKCRAMRSVVAQKLAA